MSDVRPVNCRFRLCDEGKPYPRSSCVACGKNIATGLGKKCTLTDLPPTREQIMADERVQALVKAGHNCRSFTALFAGGDESMILALREWDAAIATLTESP